VTYQEEEAFVSCESKKGGLFLRIAFHKIRRKAFKVI